MFLLAVPVACATGYTLSLATRANCEKIILSNETLQDEIAVSVARVLASANSKAKELGVYLKESLITARAAFGKRRLAMARACAAQEITSGSAEVI